MRYIVFLHLILLFSEGHKVKLIELYKSSKKSYYIPKLYKLRGDFIYPGDFYVVKDGDSLKITFELENIRHQFSRYYKIIKVKENCFDRSLLNSPKRSNCKFHFKSNLFNCELVDTSFTKSFILKKGEHLVITDGRSDHFLLDIEQLFNDSTP